MSLIEQPTRKVTVSLRVQDTSGYEYCHFAEKHMWATDFPPENARLKSHQDFAVSGRPTDQVDDTYETHVLVLGTSEDELADIASTSADRCLSGVEVNTTVAYHALWAGLLGQLGRSNSIPATESVLCTLTSFGRSACGFNSSPTEHVVLFLGIPHTRTQAMTLATLQSSSFLQEFT